MGASQLYDQHASLYDRATQPLDQMLDEQRRQLLAHAHGRVLDIAVGTGKNLPFYPAECQLWGVDLAAGMLQRAQQRALLFGREIALVQGDAASLPYPDASFDTIVCTLGGCIFPDPIRTFQEFRRVCRATGRLLFLEHVRPPQPLLSLLADALTPISARVVGCHPNRPTVQYLQDAGLKLVNLTTSVAGILVSVIAKP